MSGEFNNDEECQDDVEFLEEIIEQEEGILEENKKNYTQNINQLLEGLLKASNFDRFIDATYPQSED